MEHFNFYSLSNKNLYELAEFVVAENFNHHENNSDTEEFKTEVENIYREEKTFKKSKIFVSRDSNGKISGSIRVLKWNLTDILPIEKLFQINPSALVGSTKTDIWHIGRFAIKKGIDKTGFGIFKTLMAHAINEVCQNKNSVAIAECDAKLLKVLKLLGIEAITLAEPLHYLGSETIPVLLTFNGLKKFLDKNYHLMSQETSTLHQSVVLQKTA
ncbi:hypothetical protein [Chryseobacterium pennipullorum]|uniref:N-acetyltransferase domain-containing protein n=1 Tax=Chryseobacterium pennipullorum TaxID=2258963 RepID=A0A3D9AM65_9FLAO|nr:hypothetical protein [Chryseobacterium pennipullorum]REC42371.1 hypothetical protein DRF67_20705 [Chryseobacterium pennipullorum]